MQSRPQSYGQSRSPAARGKAPALTHDDVWAAIDRLARQNDMTPSGLARRAGLDPTTFNKSKRFAADGRPRWPSTESISKILKATNASAAELFGSMTPDHGRRTAGIALPVTFLGEARAGGLVSPGPESAVIDPAAARTIDMLPEADHPVYALAVHGTFMEPVFRAGATLVISMTAPVEAGDRVVVRTADDVLVKVLRAMTRNTLELGAMNPAQPDITVPRGEVAWMARIMWASQ